MSQHLVPVSQECGRTDWGDLREPWSTLVGPGVGVVHHQELSAHTDAQHFLHLNAHFYVFVFNLLFKDLFCFYMCVCEWGA